MEILDLRLSQDHETVLKLKSMAISIQVNSLRYGLIWTTPGVVRSVCKRLASSQPKPVTNVRTGVDFLRSSPWIIKVMHAARSILITKIISWLVERFLGQQSTDIYIGQSNLLR